MCEREKDTLERPGYTGELIRYVPTPALHLGGVVRDIPPIVQVVGRVEARHPVELIYHWGCHGFPRYGIEDFANRDCWTFSNDMQEAAAIGFKWLENNCALEQIPEDQDGEVVYGYVARGVVDEPDLEHMLYNGDIWKAAGADMNEVATPEILTCVRNELFRVYASRGGGPFFLLDFSDPKKVAQYLADWANEVEEERLFGE